MRKSKRISIFGRNLTSMGLAGLAWFCACFPVVTARGGDAPERSPILSERLFQDKLRLAVRPGDAAEQARLVNRLLLEGRFSSLQIKAMSKLLIQEDARYDFALAAFPRTVDPENFYEVYDAFTSFSKVLRLHDQIQQFRDSTGPSGRPAFQPVSNEAMAEILKSIRAEGLEDNKKTLARQVFAGRRRFLSRQVVEILKAFAFEDTRLEVAKLAYDAVLDPESYFLVNQAFSFPSSKDTLARYLESRQEERPRPPRR